MIRLPTDTWAALLERGATPIQEVQLRRPQDRDVSQYWIFGVPSELADANTREWLTNSQATIELEPFCFQVQRLVGVTGGFAATTRPRFYASIPAEVPLGDMDAVSGAPVFSLTPNSAGTFDIWLDAVQAQWKSSVRTIAATPFPESIDILQRGCSSLVENANEVYNRFPEHMMDTVDFLDSDTVDLPKTRMGAYPDFVDRLLDDYHTQLQRVVPRSFIDQAVANEVRRVVPLSNAVREVISLLVGGDRTSAYSRLDAALRELDPHLRALMPSSDMSQFVNPMYRFRTIGHAPYFKGDLFHIPFDLRHIVQPMRYSVAGLPSLYLGGSTHVCWRELGEPDLTTVAVTRFHAVENSGLRVLNFGNRLPVLAAYVANVPEDFTGPTNAAAVIAAQVACWPLIAACSIRVPDRTAPDRPEYLVPQLMLEWITRTHQFHGIRYFSTHYSEYPDDPKTYMNYVFPASSIPPVGYCSELCKLFNLTDPVSWADAKTAPEAGVKRPRYKTREVLDTALEAEFGRAEDGLLGMPVGPLASCPEQLLLAIRSRVQLRAYKIWETEDHPHGRENAHWFQAKAELGIPEDVFV